LYTFITIFSFLAVDFFTCSLLFAPQSLFGRAVFIIEPAIEMNIFFHRDSTKNYRPNKYDVEIDTIHFYM